MALAEAWKHDGDEQAFAIDSVAIPCCDNARIRQWRLNPPDRTDGAFRGYQGSKRRCFYGLRIRAVVNEHGRPVEVYLTQGRHSDTGESKNVAVDLPEELGRLRRQGLHRRRDRGRARRGRRGAARRRPDPTRPRPAWQTDVLQHSRETLETAVGETETLLPTSIPAVTGRGVELKVYLLVVACSLAGLG